MKILVTGMGTIGNEFIKQLLERGDEVTAVDNNEWAVASYPDHPKLKKHLSDFFRIGGRFDLVIHTAAYKHVDLIEKNKKAAYYNNIGATYWLYRETKGSKILFISTDKAVEPKSYYGETKQEGERLTYKHGGIVARLGNVLASSGSVIPKWEKCIEDSQPIPITDWKMTRYFIPVDKAVDKILKLWKIAKPKQVIIPDMGKPIALKKIFKQVLAKHHLWRYPTEIIGKRKGEKLHEKLHWKDEKLVKRNDYGKIYDYNSNVHLEKTSTD